jgi:hypothetical protein
MNDTFMDVFMSIILCIIYIINTVSERMHKIDRFLMLFIYLRWHPRIYKVHCANSLEFNEKAGSKIEHVEKRREAGIN